MYIKLEQKIYEGGIQFYIQYLTIAITAVINIGNRILVTVYWGFN